MSETMMDDDLEPKPSVKRGELVMAGLCFCLSLLCGLLWLSLLIAPNLLSSLF